MTTQFEPENRRKDEDQADQDQRHNIELRDIRWKVSAICNVPGELERLRAALEKALPRCRFAGTGAGLPTRSWLPIGLSNEEILCIACAIHDYHKIQHNENTTPIWYSDDFVKNARFFAIRDGLVPQLDARDMVEIYRRLDEALASPGLDTGDISRRSSGLIVAIKRCMADILNFMDSSDKPAWVRQQLAIGVRGSVDDVASSARRLGLDTTIRQLAARHSDDDMLPASACDALMHELEALMATAKGAKKAVRLLAEARETEAPPPKPRSAAKAKKRKRQPGV